MWIKPILLCHVSNILVRTWCLHIKHIDTSSVPSQTVHFIMGVLYLSALFMFKWMFIHLFVDYMIATKINQMNDGFLFVGHEQLEVLCTSLKAGRNYHPCKQKSCCS